MLRVSHVWDRRVRDKTGRLSASCGRIILTHARGPGLPRARRRRRRLDRPRARPAARKTPGSIRFAGRDEPPFDRLASPRAGSFRWPSVPAGSDSGCFASRSVRSQPGRHCRRRRTGAGRPPRRAGNPQPRAQARPGQTGRLAVAARGRLRRSRPGPARSPSGTRGCPPRAGST